MRTEVFEGIEAVARDVWGRVVTCQPFAGWDWCYFAEGASPATVYYVVVYEGDEAVGGAILTVMAEESIPSSNPVVTWLMGRYLRWRPLIVARTRGTTNHKGIFLPDDPAQAARVLAELRRVAGEITQRHGGSFFLADYLADADLAHDWGTFYPLRDFGDAGTRLTVEWASYDDYLATLRERSKKQYKNVIHNMRYAEAGGITVRRNAAPPEDVALRLIQGTMDHYRTPYDQAAAQGVIRALPRLPERNYTWLTAECEGETVACELMFFDETNRMSLVSLYGRDYSVPYVYFALAYADIQYAIEELKARVILYGTATYDFKRRLGFVDEARNHLVFCPGTGFERRLTGLLMRFMDG